MFGSRPGSGRRHLASGGGGSEDLVVFRSDWRHYNHCRLASRDAANVLVINHAGGTHLMGKNKKTPTKSLKEKRQEKKAKEADKPSAKTVSKTARASGAKG
jgi:hypothetical protein